MGVMSLSEDLRGFAIELCKLAYTMPGGVEDPLIRLSERMVRHAQQQIDENRSRSMDLRAGLATAIGGWG